MVGVVLGLHRLFFNLDRNENQPTKNNPDSLYESVQKFKLIN